MSNVIAFLEKPGRDARLMQAAKEAVALALADAKIDACAGEIILARDMDERHALLKAVPLNRIQMLPQREAGERSNKPGKGELV